MIAAHKYLNLDLSVVNISALIIQVLKKDHVVTYDELLYYATSVLGENVKETYPYSLNFLFLLGKIRYLDGDSDAFELNETK
jgi:hypothetical protein